jgi:hypothetical protein
MPAVAFVIVGVLAMTTNGDGGPSAFVAFFSVVMAVIAASGLLGYGAVDAWQEHRSRAQLPPRPRRNGRRLEGGRHSSTGRDPASPGARPDQDQTRADLRTRRPGHASIWPTLVGRGYTAEPTRYPV